MGVPVCVRVVCVRVCHVCVYRVCLCVSCVSTTHRTHLTAHRPLRVVRPEMGALAEGRARAVPVRIYKGVMSRSGVSVCPMHATIPYVLRMGVLHGAHATPPLCPT